MRLRVVAHREQSAIRPDDDLGFEAMSGRLTINQSLERVKGKTVFKSPKTTTSRRTITLPALTAEALKQHRAAQAKERLTVGLGKPELVFSHADGSRKFS